MARRRLREARVSSSWKIFTTCWPGVTLRSTSSPERFLFDPGDEVLRHLVIDIGLEQSQPHLAHGVTDIRLADRAVTAQVLENILQFIAEL